MSSIIAFMKYSTYIHSISFLSGMKVIYGSCGYLPLFLYFRHFMSLCDVDYLFLTFSLAYAFIYFGYCITCQPRTLAVIYWRWLTCKISHYYHSFREFFPSKMSCTKKSLHVQTKYELFILEFPTLLLKLEKKLEKYFRTKNVTNCYEVGLHVKNKNPGGVSLNNNDHKYLIITYIAIHPSNVQKYPPTAAQKQYARCAYILACVYKTIKTIGVHNLEGCLMGVVSSDR